MRRFAVSRCCRTSRSARIRMPTATDVTSEAAPAISPQGVSDAKATAEQHPNELARMEQAAIRVVDLNRR